MNIESLRIFCSVVQHESFSRGATANNVTQSAATQAVHRLEEELQVRLLDRSRRPFVLTPEGEISYDGFRRVLEHYDNVFDQVRSLHKEINGKISVAAIYSVGLHSMGACMRSFMRKFPKATVRLEYLRPNEVYEAVAEGLVDLGIVSYPEPSSEIEVLPLRSEPMVLVCPPNHRLAQHETISISSLGDEPFVGFDRQLIIRKKIDRLFRRHGIATRMMMEFDNIETIKQAVEIGAGVSILPEPTVKREQQTGTLATVGLIEGELTRPIGIIRLQRRVASPAVTQFVKMLRVSQPPALLAVG